MNEAFAAVGSEDGYLRMWPLDFSEVFVEAGEPALCVYLCPSSYAPVSGSICVYMSLCIGLSASI